MTQMSIWSVLSEAPQEEVAKKPTATKLARRHIARRKWPLWRFRIVKDEHVVIVDGKRIREFDKYSSSEGHAKTTLQHFIARELGKPGIWARIELKLVGCTPPR